MNFKINLIFLIKPFFLHDQKSQDKNLNILRKKRAFKMKLKVFFIIFEGLSLKQIKNIMEGESPTLTKLKKINNKYLFFVYSESRSTSKP